MHRPAVLVLTLAFSATVAVADDSPVRKVLDPIARNAPRSEVLVLATPHLADMKGFQPQFVAPVIDVLERFRPTIVCVEVMPGEDLETMEDAGGKRAEVAAMFAETQMKLGSELRRTMGISRAEAQRRAEEALHAGALTPDARAKLVVNLMAAYEFSSALLQWSYLEPELRASTPVVPNDVKEWLDKRLASNNEISTIAVPLARRLGLQTLVPVDSQDGAAKLLALPDEQITELFEHPFQKRVAKAAIYARSAEATAAAIERGNFLPLYLYMNSDAYLAGDIEAQWGWYWQSKLASGADRLRYSLWEVRNLEIAAKLALQTASPREERVLLLIGSAHKRFVEEILGGLVHVRLVELNRIAGAERR